jgi:anti-sigma factor RsiW
MTSDEHISAQNLQALFSGGLTDAAAEIVIAHLAACDRCLTLADELWAETAARTIPDFDHERATRVEGRLRQNIYRSNLGGQVVRLGTQGLLRVWFGLLGPFLGGKQKKDRGDQRIEH